ncbi:MAG: hypothetical protein PHO37_01690 [Kiritimatiellae bacterium]|nr:hypothetical protein [Kiritimatiellia bacterium]
MAALIFLVPFTAAILLGLLVNHLSPGKKQAQAARKAEQSAAPVCPAGADRAALLQHRAALRKLGLPIEFTNIRIWAATALPELLITLPPMEEGTRCEWHLSRDGKYALAVEKSTGGDALRRKVGLYSFVEDLWLWQNTLPWPETHEGPWVFNNTTVVRSSKNNRRFAMEIDPTGKIVAIDALGAGGPFPVKAPVRDAGIPGRPVAVASNLYFVCDEQDSTLKGYALRDLPGLYDVGAFDQYTCFSGNGLLKFRAADGFVTIYDAFTQLKLETKEAWNASTNTTVLALEANRDGSELKVQLATTFQMVEPVVREWTLLYKPVDDTITLNTTNAVSRAVQTSSTSIQTPDGAWRIHLRENSVLEIASEKSKDEVVQVDLKEYMRCGNNPVTAISLLMDNRFILLEQRNHATLLDLHTILHYGDLSARWEHCEDLLAAEGKEQSEDSDPAITPTPEIFSESKEDDLDNFNYEMVDYSYDFDPRLFEPPSKPSVLSIQAERLANHHAWVYAACKLEQLMRIEEHDNRAPRANPLLYTRYNLLIGDQLRVKQGCQKALDALFYDTTPFNGMIRWQMLKTLFND